MLAPDASANSTSKDYFVFTKTINPCEIGKNRKSRAKIKAKWRMKGKQIVAKHINKHQTKARMKPKETGRISN